MELNKIEILLALYGYCITLDYTRAMSSTNAINMSTDETILTEMSHVSVSQVVFRNIEATLREHTINVIKKLSEIYKFDAEEAMSHLSWDIKPLDKPTRTSRKKTSSKDGETKPKKEKVKRAIPAIPLPWCGSVVEEWCQAIKSNHGLYTQCTNARAEDKTMCKTCEKKASTTTSGTTKYGVVTDRDGAFFTHKVTPYTSVMKKQNITKEVAIAEAGKFGWTIPESAFEELGGKRGRPKKDTSDTSSEDKSKSPGKRGRPKKEKPLASASAADDMLASVIAQAGNLPISDDASKISGTSGDAGASPKKKKVLTDEQKAKMAEGRARKAAEKAEQKRIEAAAEAQAIRKNVVEVAAAVAVPPSHVSAPGAFPVADIELSQEDVSSSEGEDEDEEQTDAFMDDTQSNNISSHSDEENSESEESSDDEDEVELEVKVIGGKSYNIDMKTNNVYIVDKEGNAELYGVYDPKKNKVIKNKH